MGVITTPNFYKSLTFDGTSSRTYGVFITGEAVYNAPERAVEMISIPGRNGAFALDRGRFENIEVTYPAGIFAENEEDFADAISDFRNYLCSKKGYCRLTDDYNSGEYRLAVYKSGLEVTPAQLKAGEFNIVFECKPQRFLISGEAAVSISNGGVINNPTLFESYPLIAVEGYGNIGFNGYNINIENAVLGTVILTTGFNTSIVSAQSKTLQTGKYNNGDTITISNLELQVGYIRSIKSSYSLPTVTDSRTGFISTAQDISTSYRDIIKFTTKCSSLTFTAGTSSSVTNIVTASGPPNFTYTLTVEYSALTNEIIIRLTSGSNTWSVSAWNCSIYTDDITVNSTISILGHPTYIDCEIGECYLIKNNEYISLNSAISLGNELPNLAVGNTTVTCDNTVTDLKITPKWWKV